MRQTWFVRTWVHEVKIEATTQLTGAISTDQFIRAMQNATGGSIEVTAVKQTVSSAVAIPGDIAAWGIESVDGATESPVRTQFKAGVAETFNVSAENVVITGVSTARRQLLGGRQLQGTSVKVEYTVEADSVVPTWCHSRPRLCCYTRVCHHKSGQSCSRKQDLSF